MRKAGPIKIEPFRHPITVDPQYADKTWKVLEDAIREIHNQNASGLSFEELYRNAYNMVLHKHGPRLYDGLIATLRAHLSDIAGKIEGKEGSPFLKELKKRWDEHNKSTQMIRDILMYMDRTFVVQQQKTPVFTLGLELWRDVVVRNSKISERLLSILMQLITKERQGEVIERGLIKSVTQMLVELGHSVYVEDFEKPFLASAAEFYRTEAHAFITTSDCPDYLRKAEQRLHEEQERCLAYLDASTEPKITRVVETELLRNQMTALLEMENSGLVALLRDDKYEDLSRLYSLMRRPHVDNGLATVRNMLCEHVKEVGRALVTDPERTKDPVEYVQALLDMRDKYEKIITQAFSDDKTFRNALNQAFEHFVNLNPRSPEFISLFIDDKLRRGIKGLSDTDVEGVLDKVMALFRYLQEKDVFEKYYKQHLAKRLLSGRTTSDDAERNLLVKLKTECGYQFTSKLESMFTDIKTSRDTMADFRTKLVEGGRLEELGGIDLQVQVLTTGSWPTQAPSKCNLPRELEAACEAFRSFYLSTHNGRRLTFQPNMGTADLRAVFGGGRRHELNVSTYQMCILLLFNEQDSMAYREIAQATEIPAPDLKRALQSLACVKGRNVLRKEPASKDVLETDVFYFNDKFTSKLIKVKISTVAATKEGENEKAETRQKVEEDRKPQIEAAIVRIMKARQRLDHNTIITEVTRQLSARFVPNPATIKKRIESLIEREFLARDENDRKFYTYVA
ncbi:Cullin-3A [Pleodorina starrii]|uniref:Cullin-3A n=1 Tax=Pleodorina starrii TaxID=330485 RepID=A0A9W6BEX7_9CHLO|nr:Cullin-3A [Pleodorina starrii]GLC50483.1 Cullin-3A [Pleodorina starrii]GLC73281.1 Cullin-3A [Pleodorina starrii]